MAAPFDKSGIIEFFLIEAGEHIQSLNKGLLSLEKDSKNSGMIDELFRAAHTLKGSAAMMGFQGISDVAHKAEDMLGQFRAGSAPIRKDTLNFLFDSVDAINILVDGVSSNKPEDPLLVESISQSYKDVVDNLQKAVAPEPQKQKNELVQGEGRCAGRSRRAFSQEAAGRARRSLGKELRFTASGTTRRQNRGSRPCCENSFSGSAKEEKRRGRRSLGADL